MYMKELDKHYMCYVCITIVCLCLDKMLNSHTIQLATAFLLNCAQFSFLNSSDSATSLSKVCSQFY